MRQSRRKKWNPGYSGWRPIATNGHFDKLAPLTESEHIRWVLACKGLVFRSCKPIHDEALRRWAMNRSA